MYIHICMLYQLKRAGISQLDLMKIYVSVIRPVLEYACPVWSTNLPKYLSVAIEMIQKRVLRSIYPGLHYAYILVLVSLQSLKKRRDDIYMLKPASDYKLIRRFRLSRRCRSSCRDFRLATGTLRLADACAQTDN